MIEIRCQTDALGPSAVLVVREPSVGLEGYVVVDNVAAGPAIGGIRIAPDISVEEVARLARAMTLKNAAAGLPHGGGKAGIVGDPHAPLARKEPVIRAFARAIRTLDQYVPGPDMGTDEACMAFIRDEIGRVVGLPRVVGGIPLDEIGATGLGCAAAADVAAPAAGIALDGARVAVQGYGAVGRWTARYLAERGARLVAASDSRGAICAPDGLDLDALEAHKDAGNSVATFGGGEAIAGDALVGVDCEIWVPAARPDVLHAGNIEALRARLVLQGANIPATPEAEARMHERGIVSVPDFVCNAGGVICAAVEYHGGTEATARETIVARIRDNVRSVLDRVKRDRLTPRAAAIALAQARVEEAMRYHQP